MELGRKPGWDERDLKIIRSVHDSPNASATEIAEATKIPLGTVQKRLRKLKDSAILKVEFNFRHPHSPFPTRALISIDVDPRVISHNAAGYSNQRTFCNYLARQLPEGQKMEEVIVESVHGLLGGRADIVALVAAKSFDALVNFVTNVLRLLPGIKETNTAMVFSSEEMQHSCSTPSPLGALTHRTPVSP